jgi:hypothetical protein
MSNILAQIAEIQALDLAGLRERWKLFYGTEAPAYSREHLVRRLAYRVQELAHGGLNEATRVKLRAVAEKEAPDGQVRPLPRRDANRGAPVNGTVMTREWHGERHEVTAVDEGFEYRGQTYRSLSAIAKQITGAHWNGRLFFGLVTRRKDG